MKLTPAIVTDLAAPPGQSEAIVFDDDLPGLGLRIRASGAKVWIFQYRLGKRVRRISFGDAGVVSLAKARKTAAELHAQVRLGGDPAGDKVETRRRAGDTMAAALAAYMPYQKSRLKPLSLKQNERHLIKHCKPLHTMQLSQVDRRTIAARIAAIATKSGPVEANRVASSVEAFFNWTAREGLTEGLNPAANISRRKERSRGPTLSDDELRAIWQATVDDRDYSAIIRLLMLTGCRVAEIGGLKWSELVGGSLVLPASRTKNAREHVVPLAPAARAIIDGRPRSNREYVFGRADGFSGWSASKAELDERLGDSVGAWVHHDLRRTTATRLADLGISSDAIESVLNHVSGFRHGVHGVYNRSDYSAAKRHALNAWADHLLSIVEGRAKPAKVVPLHA